MDNRQHSSDAALLAAIAARDGAAFAVFYRRHVPTVLAYLMRETRDPEASADLAAEVFAAVLLAAGRYAEQNDSAAPWLIGIARNKLLMSWRRGRVEARARHRLGFEPVALDDGDLDRIVEVAQGGAGILRLVDDLPADERRRRSARACSTSALTARSPPNSNARRWSCASGSAAVWPGCASRSKETGSA